jgi:hypothetical protein
LRKQFLTERAELMAEQLRTTEEKALCAILRAEESRGTYRTLRELLGKQNTPLTQVDVTLDTSDNVFPFTTLTHREDIEDQILRRNHKHSLQSLSTTFMKKPHLKHSIDPNSPYNRFDEFLTGDFSHCIDDTFQLNDTERAWIQSMKSAVKEEISLDMSIEDFKAFFKSKQERTASSPSGRHMGHYKVANKCT